MTIINKWLADHLCEIQINCKNQSAIKVHNTTYMRLHRTMQKSQKHCKEDNNLRVQKQSITYII